MSECEYCDGFGCSRCVAVCYTCGKAHADYYLGSYTYCERCYYDELEAQND
jgi:hypothetical protein